MKYHKTKLGHKIKLSDLELSHLENIIKWIEDKAIKGFTIRMGGGYGAEDMWCDECTYYGKAVKHHLKYDEYKAELNKRNKVKNLKKL
jgi:hypothetical protein